VLDVAAVPCSQRLQKALALSVEQTTGLPARHLPSGAGHDAMVVAAITDVGMLFVRCGNGGISHHPAESLSDADAEIAAETFKHFLLNFKPSS